jgi:hypothetical protein
VWSPWAARTPQRRGDGLAPGWLAAASQHAAPNT